LPFCLFAYAALFVSAGVDSVLNATTPLWAAVIASVAFQVPMTRPKLIGLLAGFAGVVVLVWETLADGAAGAPLAVAGGLAAALSYGVAVNYSKRHFAGVTPAVVAFGSQMFASILLWPLAAMTWPQHAIGLSIWACVGALGVVCTALGYLLYFRLIENAGANYAASVTFLIPVFGLFWGAVFLGERLTPTALAGCAIILLGTLIANGRSFPLLNRLRRT
jgi:drug/metabolite transporter (DMT)-like permease